MRTKRTCLTALLIVATGVGYGGRCWAQSPEGYVPPPPASGELQRTWPEQSPDQAQYPTAENADGKSPEDLRIRVAVEQILKEKEDARKADEARKKEQAEREGYEVGTDLKMSARWNPGSGVTFETPNKDFVSHLGFRLQFDNVYFRQDDAIRVPTAAGGVGELQDGFFFRRIRPSWDGTAWEVMEWNCELALEQVKQGIPTLDECWVGIKEVPYIGSIRIGHYKVPQGFEGDMVSSSKTMTFLERSPYTDAFYDNFAPGFWCGNSILDQHVTWSAMWYRPELDLHDNNGADFQDGRYGVSGRLTALPIYENDGRQLLHLGASGTWREADKPDAANAAAGQGGITGPEVVRFRARPGLRDAQGDFGTAPLPGNSVRWVDTGNIVADGASILGAEFFAVNGPFSAQAEYAWTFVPGAVVGGVSDTLAFNGGYVQLSYFPTGENRVYDRRLGRLGSTYIAAPFTNFWAVRTQDGPLCLGWGAWEIAARYNYLDLNDGGIQGGRLQEFNFGVNWYLNVNWKMQFEYIHDRRYDLRAGQIPGDMDGLGIRTQFFF